MSETPTGPRGEPPHDPTLDAWLRDARETPAPEPPDLEETYRALEAQTRAERGRSLPRLRALPTPLRYAIALGLSGAMIAMVALMAPRADLRALPVWRHLVVLGGAGLVLALCLRGALRPQQLPSLGWAKAIGGGALAVAVAAAFALLAPPDVHASAAHGVCFLGGLAMGLPVLLVARLLDRGTLAGPLLASVSAGLAGYLALHMHCGIDDRLHLVFGHATVVLAFLVLAGAAQWMRRRDPT